MTITAYSYLRFSKTAQARGDTIRRQMELAREWIAEHPHITLDETLRDEGISAVSGKHRVEGALGSFLHQVEIGKVKRGSYLLIEGFDRLSRENETQAINLLTSLTISGITVVTLFDGRVYDQASGSDSLYKALTAMDLAHNEIKRRTKRVLAAWKQKKITARETGKTVTSRGPAWLQYNPETTKFDLIPSRVAVIERIFDDYASGIGMSTITNRLNQEAVPPFTKNSKGWHVGYVGELLRSQTVLGHYQPHKVRKTDDFKVKRELDGELIRDFYPAAISEERFYAAQAHRNRPSNANRKGAPTGRRGRVYANTMMGLARCEKCSGTLVVVRQEDKAKSRSFLCYSKTRNAGCTNNTRYRVAKAENALFSAIATRKATADSTTNREAHVYHKINALEAQLAEARTANANLMMLVERGHEASIERAMAKEAEIKSLLAELETVRADLNSPTIPHAEIIDAVKWLRKSAEIEAAALAGDKEAETELFNYRAKLNAILRDLYDWIIPTIDGVIVGKGVTVTAFEEADFDAWSPAGAKHKGRTRMRTTLELDEPIETPTSAVLLPLLRERGKATIDAIG
ncbi:recombinase family protein [Brevundimonas sp. BH3]|uniref:recombinase family protein n=1 Tax=Brevundimonas sp. BH3 TaxID=3133089 RepID=UPI00324CA86B